MFTLLKNIRYEYKEHLKISDPTNFQHEVKWRSERNLNFKKTDILLLSFPFANHGDRHRAHDITTNIAVLWMKLSVWLK